MRRRLLVYGALLLALLGVGVHLAFDSAPVRVEIALWKMRHPHAHIAIQHLYYTKWAAVDPVLAHAEDPHRISFLVERNLELPGIRRVQGFGVEGPGSPLRQRPPAATGRRAGSGRRCRPSWSRATAT